MTALAATTAVSIGWGYFVDEIIGGEWASTPGYELLFTIEHAGHEWVTNNKAILRRDLLPPLDALAEEDRPTLTAYAPTAANEIRARLDNPWLPSRHADVVEGFPLFEAGLLAPLVVAGLELADDLDARLPQPLLLGDSVVGLLMPFNPGRGFTALDSIYLPTVSPFLCRAHDVLTTQWSALADVCDRQVWNAAAALENSGAFAQSGEE